MNSLLNKISEMGRKAHLAITAPKKEHIQLMLFAVGVVLLSVGMVKGAIAQDTISDVEASYNDERIGRAVAKIFTYLEGSFGVLVMVCAGLGAILSSAFGQYRAALGCLVVAVGAFILRSFVITFFNVEGIEGLEQ